MIGITATTRDYDQIMMMCRRIAVADDSAVGFNVVRVAAELDELLRRVDLRLGEINNNIAHMILFPLLLLLQIDFVINFVGCGFA